MSYLESLNPAGDPLLSEALCIVMTDILQSVDVNVSTCTKLVSNKHF